MFKSYIIIALRRLVRERFYVFINILSLAVGIASFLLLALCIRSELTYDQHHQNYQRIYRLTGELQQGGVGTEFAITPVGLGPLLVKDFPQLGRQVRFRPSSQNVLTYETKQRQWDRIYMADPSVFEVFTHRILYGDPTKALVAPYSIALSETVARYYFGDENPIGKRLGSGTLSYSVTLVYADLPENSHFKYDVLLPISLMDVFSPGFSKSYTNSLWYPVVYTYLMLSPEFDPREFTQVSTQFVDRYMGEQSRVRRATYIPHLQPLVDSHFGKKLQNDEVTGNIFYVYGFAAVGLFTLLIGCINYMNLATARAMRRAKEVGMRKVIGASRGQLVAQFLGESYTFTVAALIVSLIALQGLLLFTPIGELMNKLELQRAVGEPAVWAGLGALSIVVGLVAGLYPAFYLSGISPLASLTALKKSWKAGVVMREVLVLWQLLVSVTVIACAILMANQMRYLNAKPLGFEKQNRLIVTLRHYDVVNSIPTIMAELLRVPGVLGVTSIADVPGTGNHSTSMFVEKEGGGMEPMSLDSILVGTNFAEALKIGIVEGRSFSADVKTDMFRAAVVNETLVKKLGWSRPIGKRLRTGSEVLSVIGVTKDFHYASLHNAVAPLVMIPIPDYFGAPPPINQRAFIMRQIIVVLSGEALGAAMERVQALISRFDPRFQFEPVFLEEKLDALYRSDINLMRLTVIFAGICVLISVLGLYGLAAFAAEQRAKEISIRKVLGASDASIVMLLSWRLVPLLLIAAIPASILSRLVIERWLERFAYHAAVQWSVFLIAAACVAVVAFGAVVVQAMKTARAEPIDALRHD